MTLTFSMVFMGLSNNKYCYPIYSTKGCNEILDKTMEI